MLLAQEETFGPVAPIFTFTDEDDVVRRANDSDYGLAGLLLHRRPEPGDPGRGAAGVRHGRRQRRQISAVQAPFGGVKQSGIGREGGPLGIDEYLDTKYVSLGGL